MDSRDLAVSSRADQTEAEDNNRQRTHTEYNPSPHKHPHSPKNEKSLYCPSRSFLCNPQVMAEAPSLKSSSHGESGWRNIFPSNYLSEGKADGAKSSLAANDFPLKRLSPPILMADGVLSAITPGKRFNAKSQRYKGAKKMTVLSAQ